MPTQQLGGAVPVGGCVVKRAAMAQTAMWRALKASAASIDVAAVARRLPSSLAAPAAAVAARGCMHLAEHRR